MAEEQRKKKKRRKKNYLLRLLAVIALGVALYLLLSSHIFDVQRVSVENNDHYTSEQIAEKAGVSAGVNIFAVNIGQIKENLLQDPYIRNVRVKRSLPGTIAIIVEERRESATVPYGDTFIVVDEYGMVLRRTEREPKLTVLLGLSVRTIEEGKPLEAEENSALTGALKIVEAMESTDVYFKKIDISGVIIKAYVYDQLICQGTPENILNSMINGKLETLLYELYTKGTERGIISVGSGNEYPFSPLVE